MAFKQEKLALDAVIPALRANNHKQVYQEICKISGYATRINPAQIFDKLMMHEREETSGIGDGVAIPHITINGLHKPYMLFARLEKAIDFDAVDGHPVDLLFLILSPEDDGPYHLRRLSTISRMFRDKQLRLNLRGTQDTDTLHSLLLDPEFRSLAAA